MGRGLARRKMMRQMHITMQCVIVPVSRTGHQEPVCEGVVHRFQADLGLLAVGKYLSDFCSNQLQESCKIFRGIAGNADVVGMQSESLPIALTSTILLMIIIVMMLCANESTFWKYHGSSMVGPEPAEEQVAHVIQDLTDTSMEAEQLETLKQEVAKKRCELALSNAKLDAMACHVAKLEADLLQSNERAALQDRRLNSILREKEQLSELLKLEVETYDVLLEREHEKVQRIATTAADQLSLLQAELQQAREHSALQDERLHRAMQEKGTLELEVETCEALLEQECDQAQRIVSTVKRSGCALDTDLGLKSKYAEDALNGLCVSGDCSIIVNYQNSLSNPVGAIVYAHDKQQCATEILCAFATPKRGITAANLAAVKEYARRQGDDKLVLEAVRNAEKFWQLMGFISDAEQPDYDLIRMSMSLSDAL